MDDPGIWLTVPTRFDRPSLFPALSSSGVPLSQSVVVQTGGEVRERGLSHLILDFDPPNIQRWWNRGLDYAEGHGADICLVINDDIVCHEPLTKLAEALRSSTATLAAPEGFKIPGWCYALNLRHDIRPDEAYEWWYGDWDLWLRAESDGQGVITVPLAVEHLLHSSGLADWQQAATKRDRARFQAAYPGLLDEDKWQVLGLSAAAVGVFLLYRYTRRRP